MLVKKMLFFLATYISVQTGACGEILRLSGCAKFDAKFSESKIGVVLKGSVVHSLPGATSKECYHACVEHARCKSINVHTEVGCELNSNDLRDEGAKLEKKNNWVYMETATSSDYLGPICNLHSPCYTGKCRDVCESPGYECQCEHGYSGDLCQHFEGQALNYAYGMNDFLHYPTRTFSFSENSTGFTFCAWINITDAAGKAIFGIFEESPRKDGHMRCNYPVFEIKDPGELKLLYDSKRAKHINVPINRWTHVCFSLEKAPLIKQSAFYVNSVNEGAIEYPSESLFDPMKVWKLVLGNDVDFVGGECMVNNANQGFIGFISQANFWSRYMSDLEISKVYKMQAQYAESLLLSWQTLLKDDAVGRSALLQQVGFHLNLKTLI